MEKITGRSRRIIRRGGLRLTVIKGKSIVNSIIIRGGIAIVIQVEDIQMEVVAIVITIIVITVRVRDC